MKLWNLAAGLTFLACVAFSQAAAAQQDFRNTITGDPLDINGVAPKEGRDTPGVKKFLETGVNPYNDVKGCLPAGEETFLASCSGCHGHLGEGKVGPGLADAYWTYPKNKTDKGLFETIFGGANGMMGPHGQDLELDEMLKLMAWIRHIQVGSVEDADWLSDEQKKAYKPFKLDDWNKTEKPEALKQECKISGN